MGFLPVKPGQKYELKHKLQAEVQNFKTKAETMTKINASQSDGWKTADKNPAGKASKKPRQRLSLG